MGGGFPALAWICTGVPTLGPCPLSPLSMCLSANIGRSDSGGCFWDKKQGDMARDVLYRMHGDGSILVVANFWCILMVVNMTFLEVRYELFCDVSHILFTNSY